MNLFDKFLDSFSVKELKLRVWGVVGIGLAICAATIIGGFVFLSSTYTISAEGTGRFSESKSKTIEAVFSEKEAHILKLGDPKYAIISVPGGAVFKAPVEMQSIDPENGNVVMTADTDSVPPITVFPGRFDLRVVLYEEPYWKFLWGRGAPADE